jgi:superfamily II DNA/RNA helicase
LSQTFSTLGVPAKLVSILASQGIDAPFPIQQDTLPDTLAGKDVLGRGRTGSGKTLAFAIPLVARIGGALAGGSRRPNRPLGLVLAPTRELATQIAAVIEPLAAASGMKVTTIFGGVSQQRQVQALNSGVDIVVACPGRLEDLMKQRHLTLDAVEITVLDEADHMADLGFLPGVTRILAATPSDGQRLLFSATLDNGVDKLVKRFLSSPTVHSVDDETSHVDTMSHAVFAVDGQTSKNELIRTLASGVDRRILFVRTKHVAKRLAQQLTSQGIPAADLQGNLSQGARDRNLAAFSAGTIRVLVATDVAARGVHVDDVALVVHVDPPTEHKAYLHRSGRTARAGAIGTVVTIVLPTQDKDVRQMLRKAAIDAAPVFVTHQSQVVTELVGPVAELVHTPERPVQQQNQQPRRPRAEQGRQSQGGRTQGGRGQSGRSQGQTEGRSSARGGQRSASAPARGGSTSRWSSDAPAAGAPRGDGGRGRRSY